MNEQNKRYFHGGGLAFRVGNDFVMDPLYVGKRQERVLINPDEKEPNKPMFETQKEDFYVKTPHESGTMERKPRDPYQPTDDARIAKEYQEGSTLQALALKYHRAVPTIRNILRDEGVPIRAKGRKKGHQWSKLYK